MQKYVQQLLVGAFIVGVGVAGYIWEPKAKSALISGAVFGNQTPFVSFYLAFLPFPTFHPPIFLLLTHIHIFTLACRWVKHTMGCNHVSRWSKVG